MSEDIKVGQLVLLKMHNKGLDWMGQVYKDKFIMYYTPFHKTGIFEVWALQPIVEASEFVNKYYPNIIPLNDHGGVKSYEDLLIPNETEIINYQLVKNIWNKMRLKYPRNYKTADEEVNYHYFIDRKVIKELKKLIKNY